MHQFAECLVDFRPFLFFCVVWVALGIFQYFVELVQTFVLLPVLLVLDVTDYFIASGLDIFFVTIKILLKTAPSSALAISFKISKTLCKANEAGSS